MSIKPIPLRAINRYMSIIIAEDARLGVGYVDLNSAAFASLAEDPDFRRVIRVLIGLGYIVPNSREPNAMIRVALTDSGIAYFENARTLRAEQRWTRGLAIASIVVSIASLAVAALSLFLRFP